MSRETTIETFGMMSAYDALDEELGAPIKPLPMRKYSSSKVFSPPSLTDNVYN